MNWINVLFSKYKFMRRFAMFWAMGTVSYCVGFIAHITYILIERDEMTPDMYIAAVGLVGTVVVLIGTMNALYQWDKKLELEYGARDDSNPS